MYGNDQNNVLIGSGGNDIMVGKLGNDAYEVTEAGDLVIEKANEGIDTVTTTLDNYIMPANVEILGIYGSARTATGNALNNQMYGNELDNVLIGGEGSDILFGRGGSDTFVFNTAPSAANVDYIADFTSGDKIALTAGVFSTLSIGNLNAAAFFIGSGAHDADDRIIYNQVTGSLVYDSNGSAAGGQQEFAHLNSGLLLTAQDFFIF
jgi:Ca2+-binding RTX toxin-like protein